MNIQNESGVNTSVLINPLHSSDHTGEILVFISSYKNSKCILDQVHCWLILFTAISESELHDCKQFELQVFILFIL